MLVVLPYCQKDADQAVDLLRWMRELDGQHIVHKCLLLAPRGISHDQIEKVKREAVLSFANVRVLQTNRLEERPWPIAPNAMFRCFLKWASKNLAQSYFWWNEPDCIPLKARWLDLLEESYVKAKKPFLGFIVDKPCPHLTGCAVYPYNAAAYNPALEFGPDNIAWDCIEPTKTLKHTQHTELFHHQWMGFDGTGQPTFPTVEELKKISPKAVVFHRNKDHTLIDRLRENRDGRETKVQEAKTFKLMLKREHNSNAPAVFTYYEDLNRPEESKLIELWCDSWAEHGWKPIVLSEKDISHHQRWKGFLRRVSAFPSVNPPGYDLACYKRWAAMVTRGGGIMTDYDVMNYGFTPAKAEELKSADALTFFEERVPSVVCGEKRHYDFACSYMAAYEPAASDLSGGRPHVSDMLILQKVWKSAWIKHSPVVVQYSDPGWGKALLVHYCAWKTNGNKASAIATHP